MRGSIPLSQAERLLVLAEDVMNPRDGLIIMTGVPMDERYFTVIATAIMLRKQSPEFRFRAMAEDWDYYRIIRELY